MSGLTRTDIVNLALREIGTDRVDDWQEASPEADVARDVWEQAVKMTLARHEWHFAISAAALVQSATPPPVRYSYAYTLPGNFVRLGSVSQFPAMEPPLLDFVMRDTGIWTSAGSVYIEYVYYNDDTAPAIGTWPAWFVNVLVCDLASLMASPLKSTTERERLEALAEKRLRSGRSIDSQQSPPKRWGEGSWVAAKRGARLG
jgi:hypothetical protein